LFRPAQPGDLSQLSRIYNHYVENSHVTFDLKVQSLTERELWYSSFAETGPYRLIVMAEGDELLGYASSVRFRPKPAYASTVETSIYMDPGHSGHGLGSSLYTELLHELQAEPNVHRAIAALAMPNPGSMILHKRLGFRVVGTFYQAGMKFGRFWDITWMERDLNAAAPT